MTVPPPTTLRTFAVNTPGGARTSSIQRSHWSSASRTDDGVSATTAIRAMARARQAGEHPAGRRRSGRPRGDRIGSGSALCCPGRLIGMAAGRRLLPMTHSPSIQLAAGRVRDTDAAPGAGADAVPASGRCNPADRRGLGADRRGHGRCATARPAPAPRGDHRGGPRDRGRARAGWPGPGDDRGRGLVLLVAALRYRRFRVLVTVAGGFAAGTAAVMAGIASWPGGRLRSAEPGFLADRRRFPRSGRPGGTGGRRGGRGAWLTPAVAPGGLGHAAADRRGPADHRRAAAHAAGAGAGRRGDRGGGPAGGVRGAGPADGPRRGGSGAARGRRAGQPGDRAAGHREGIAAVRGGDRRRDGPCSSRFSAPTSGTPTCCTGPGAASGCAASAIPGPRPRFSRPSSMRRCWP